MSDDPFHEDMQAGLDWLNEVVDCDVAGNKITRRDVLQYSAPFGIESHLKHAFAAGRRSMRPKPTALSEGETIVLLQSFVRDLAEKNTNST